MRIPVSVLPGKKTREGYGAEITVTATPYLSRDLLPATFQNMVVCDLVDMLAPVITHVVNDPEGRENLEDLDGIQAAAESGTLPDYQEKRAPVRGAERRTPISPEFSRSGPSKGMRDQIRKQLGPVIMRGVAGRWWRARSVSIEQAWFRPCDAISSKRSRKTGYASTSIRSLWPGGSD